MYILLYSCGPAQVPARDRRMERCVQAVHRGHTNEADIALCQRGQCSIFISFNYILTHVLYMCVHSYTVVYILLYIHPHT